MQRHDHPRQRATSRVFAATTLGALLLASTPAPARSFRVQSMVEPGVSLMNEYSSTTSLFLVGGTGEFSGWRAGHPLSPVGMGLRYHERNGFITGTIMALLQIFAGAMTAAGPKSVNTYTEGNYRVTETTYYSAAERRAIQERASNSASNMFSSPHQSFDLELYSRNVGGDVSGWRATMMIGGFGDERRYMIDLGLGAGRATAAVAEDGMYLITHWAYFGMPIRFNYAAGPVLIFAQFDWNWLGHTRGEKVKASIAPGSTFEIHTAGFPLRVGVAAALLGRLYVEAVALTPSLSSGEFGYTAAAGARF